MQFEIKRPNFDQRKKIMEKMFKSMSIDTDVKIDDLATLTNDFSGRDIDDVCRDASMISLREYLTERESSSSSSEDEEAVMIRKVNKNDFLTAISKKKRDFNRILD